MNSIDNIVKRLRESKSEVSREVRDVASEIRDAVEKEVINFMKAKGYDEEDVRSYTRTDANFREGYLVIEVGAELTYRSLEKLGDKLNPIVAHYDKDSYFEPVDAGITAAYLDIDNLLIEATESVDIDQMKKELVEEGDYTEEELSGMRGSEIAQAWSKLPSKVNMNEEYESSFSKDVMRAVNDLAPSALHWKSGDKIKDTKTNKVAVFKGYQKNPVTGKYSAFFDYDGEIYQSSLEDMQDDIKNKILMKVK